MSNFLKINDLVEFNLTQAAVKGMGEKFSLKDYFQPVGGTSTGLVVDLAATHAGIITRNNGFYLPDRMRAGAHTFTKDYEKPILRHHNEDADSIGRIVQADYVDTSHAVAKQYAGMPIKNTKGKDVATITDKLISDFQTGNMSFGMQVDVVRNVFRDSLLMDEAFEGLGFIRIRANITDADAAQKFLDGRYLTSSVGVTTDAAVCSICKSNWVQEGPCDHKPGAMYDSAKAFLITGKLSYSEYSVVNTPADKFSKVIELHYNGSKSNIDIVNSANSLVYEVNVDFPQFSREDSMADKNLEIKDSVATQDATTVVNPPADQAVESFDQFMDRYLAISDSVSDKDEEILYGFMLAEMKDAGLSEKDIQDATLSAEKRSNLAASSFCGPGKSFPVPDCAHVSAARRLINKYKGEGDKSKILACVDRKARAMGCDSKKDSVKVEDSTASRIVHLLVSAVEENQYVYNDQDPALDEKDIKALQGVISKLVGQLGQDAMKQALLDKQFRVLMDKALVDEIVKLEEVVGDLRDKMVESDKTQAALKEEYDSIHKDMTALTDQLVTEKTKTRQVTVKLLSLYSSLKDSAVVDVTDSVKDATVQQLSEKVESLEKEVDVTKIVDRLGDGTSRIPEGTVNSPVQVVEEQRPNSEKQAVPSEVLNNWLVIDKRHGRAAADHYLASYRSQVGK